MVHVAISPPATARLLLEHCARVYVEGGACRGALDQAILAGFPDIVEALLDRGADPNAPLVLAARRNIDITRLLLARGAKPDAREKEGATALGEAARIGHLEMIQLLLEKGADPNARSSYGLTPLTLAAYYSENPAPVLKALLSAGAAPEDAVVFLEGKAAEAQGKLDESVRGGFANFAAQWRAFMAQYQTKKRLVERLAAESQAASRPAAAGVSREDLKKIVADAVQEAAKPKEPGGAFAAAVRPGYRLPERPQDFAVVVGVSKYSDLPEARFAERDAAAVVDHLAALGFARRNVVFLKGEKAVRSAMDKFIEAWLPKNVQPDSRVVFYFSGHGAPDPESGQAYLVPFDGDAGFLENTAFSLKRLYKTLGGLKAKEVLVLLDACFSGAGGRSVLAKGARPLVLKVEEAPPAAGVLTVLAAASGSQIASSSEEQGHGLFTYFLLKGLNGEARDAQGQVTAKGLYGYLKPKVEDEARRQNRSQTPAFHQGRDVLLRAQ